MNTSLEPIMKVLMRAINKLTFPCDVITQQISMSLDQKISSNARLKIRLHILFCEFCRCYQQQPMTMHTMLETYIQEAEKISLDKGPDLSPEARKKIKQKIRKSSG